MKKLTKTLAAGIAAILLGFNVQAQTINYLVVGGGGSGGGSGNSQGGGGGGGGGGVASSTGVSITAGTTYNITVGTGGAAASNTIGNYGTSSSLIGTGLSVTSNGGGGGGWGNGYYSTSPNNGENASGAGGGGGGEGYDNYTYTAVAASGGTGTDAGGTTPSGDEGGSGGGGAGGAGTSSSGTSGHIGGTGGDGSAYSITGTSVKYGAGGGGGAFTTAGAGGTYGGGIGAAAASYAANGTAGYGGGGGGSYGCTACASGAGGSGVVIISFATGIPYIATGNQPPTFSGGNTILTYNGSGTFQISNLTPTPWLLGGNVNTYNSGASDWYSIGSLDASSELPFVTNGGTEQMRIKSDGKVGIGTTSPAYLLDVNGLIRSTGNLVVSDKRFKKDINKLESVNDKIKKLSGYTYHYNTEEFKDKNFDKEQQIGLIAQEIKEVFPQLVKEDNKGYLAVNYIGMIPVLLEAIKTQQQKIDKQDSTNAALQNQLNQLANAINACCAATNSGSKVGANSQSVTLSNSDVVVLNQNQPNPYAEQTVITYNIPQSAGTAQLVFYDALGRQIKTVDIITKGAGQLNVFANDLTNGMYSYTLVIDGKAFDTKKMVKQQ